METFVRIAVLTLILGGFMYGMWISWLNYRNRNAEIPEVVKDVYDEKEYKKWLDYTMDNFKFSKVVSSIDTMITLSFLLFGVYALFDDIATSIFMNSRWQILAFLGIYHIFSTVVGIYPRYYDTFVIEEKYGFNKTTKKTFVIDQIKSFLLLALFGGAAVYGLLAIYESAGTMFFLYAWIAISSILVFINVFYTSLIVPIFNKLTPLEDGELKQGITHFAESVGYEVSKISVMNASKRTTKLNAFFVGIGKTKRVVLFDTLIEKMSNEQIIAVLAHEIGHGKHKHFLFGVVNLVINFFIYVGLFALLIRSEDLGTAFGFDGAHFGFAIIMFFSLTLPVNIIMNYLTALITRRNEYQADRFAAKNYSKKHMIEALKVIGKENFANLTPHPLVVKLNYSHPPLHDRITAINKV